MIRAIEHHDEALVEWRREDRRELRLVHVDFHDDLRGVLVDRRRLLACPIGALARGTAPLDEGNFLAHALIEGRLRGVRWVHGTPGGRAWDAGIVRYESDRFALPARLLHRLRGGPEFPLDFAEVPLDAWDGLRPGECLSVDWDCFASILDDVPGIAGRVDAFFARLGAVVPAETWAAWSPEYCHPGFAGFRDMVLRLSERFSQPVAWSSPRLELGEATPRGIDPRPDASFRMRAILALRRRGIY